MLIGISAFSQTPDYNWGFPGDAGYVPASQISPVTAYSAQPDLIQFGSKASTTHLVNFGSNHRQSSNPPRDYVFYTTNPETGVLYPTPTSRIRITPGAIYMYRIDPFTGVHSALPSSVILRR